MHCVKLFSFLHNRSQTFHTRFSGIITNRNLSTRGQRLESSSRKRQKCTRRSVFELKLGNLSGTKFWTSLTSQIWVSRILFFGDLNVVSVKK